MKHRFIRALALVLIFVTLLSVPAMAATKYYINGDYVRMRSEAKMGSDVITTLRSGTQVKVGSSKNGWKYVTTSSGTKGWVWGSYVSSSKSKSVSKTYNYVTCCSAGLYVNRKGKAVKVTALKKGNYVQLLARKKGWAKIKTTKGNIYYTQMSNLKKR